MVLLFFLPGCSSEGVSEKEVPTAVRTRFVEQYPQAREHSWSKEGSGQPVYTAFFNDHQRKTRAR